MYSSKTVPSHRNQPTDSTDALQTPSQKEDYDCPFIDEGIHLCDAYGQEVHMFLHVHLRGYDLNGKGDYMDSSYYDKYGAPIMTENSWLEGYHTVEMMLSQHINQCSNKELKFPLVVGMAGAAHLYKPIHATNPWNWTGWVPLQKRWFCDGRFFRNRHFLAIRGNEIQNNLWDYDPYKEETLENGEEDTDELLYSQIQPLDEYRGGYFFLGNPFGRYLHIISLKTPSPETKRYNYIVHPLAYRASLNNLPDNSVDAMQWSIINIAKEKNFGDGQPWGDRVNALEIFNDFTYYYSYQPHPDIDIHCHNGELAPGGKTEYVYWFNTYPLEFGEFLLDSALSRGVHLHTLTANDAFYDRNVLPPNENENKEENERRRQQSEKVLLSDPKGSIVRRHLQVVKSITPRFTLTKWEKQMLERLDNEQVKKCFDFFNTRPYRCSTVFGYTTLIDTRQQLKNIVFSPDHPDMKMHKGGLDKGELKAMDFLIDGSFYSHTGVYDLFNYDLNNQVIPYKIQNQPDAEKLCYTMTKDMDLVFTFAKCKATCVDLVWRYSIASLTESNTIQTAHGYFKLDETKTTILDLSKPYPKSSVKWIYFTAFNPCNPQKRAWFNAIKGLTFGKTKYGIDLKLPDLQHNVFSTENVEGEERRIEQSSSSFGPLACESGDLDFTFSTSPSDGDECIYVYYMQVCPNQQDLIKRPATSSKKIPPRVLQSVHGYFTLNDEHPTRLNQRSSWDKETVKDRKVYFYAIDVKNGQPISINTNPEPYLKLPTVVDKP